jgi:hypothetical protein
VCNGWKARRRTCCFSAAKFSYEEMILRLYLRRRDQSHMQRVGQPAALDPCDLFQNLMQPPPIHRGFEAHLAGRVVAQKLLEALRKACSMRSSATIPQASLTMQATE